MHLKLNMRSATPIRTCLHFYIVDPIKCLSNLHHSLRNGRQHFKIKTAHKTNEKYTFNPPKCIKEASLSLSEHPTPSYSHQKTPFQLQNNQLKAFFFSHPLVIARSSLLEIDNFSLVIATITILQVPSIALQEKSFIFLRSRNQSRKSRSSRNGKQLCIIREKRKDTSREECHQRVNKFSSVRKLITYDSFLSLDSLAKTCLW